MPWPSFKNWNWDTERWVEKAKKYTYFLQYLSTAQMDFQADWNCFQLQENVFLDVRKHCSAIVYSL